MQAIARVLQFRLEASGAAYRVPLDVDNVEELFSLASAGGDDKLVQQMTLAIAATLDFARTVAKPLTEDRPVDVGCRGTQGWTPPPSWGKPARHQEIEDRFGSPDHWYTCPRYEFYLGVLGGYFNPGGPDCRDTIITFNYDTVVEEALKSLGLPFAYGDPENTVWTSEEANRAAADAGDRLRILKLHGSVNWVAGHEAMYSPADREIKAHGVIKDFERCIGSLKNYEDVRMRGHIPLLVAPTWQKVFSGYLAAIWKEAVQALNTATRVIILGYSMPATDQHFKYLLAAGLQNNISLRKILVVNPALGDETRKKILEDRLQALFRPEHFERGVIELLPLGVDEFFVNSETGHPAHFGLPGRVFMGRTMNPPGQEF